MKIIECCCCCFKWSFSDTSDLRHRTVRSFDKIRKAVSVYSSFVWTHVFFLCDALVSLNLSGCNLIPCRCCRALSYELFLHVWTSSEFFLSLLLSYYYYQYYCCFAPPKTVKFQFHKTTGTTGYRLCQPWNRHCFNWTYLTFHDKNELYKNIDMAAIVQSSRGWLHSRAALCYVIGRILGSSFIPRIIPIPWMVCTTPL